MIGNVADDFELYGLHISPDLDTVMYTLAGIANPATGWGLQGESWRMLDMLRGYGEDTWFGLGDGDVATHVLRTHWLARGMTLTAITARLAEALGMRHRLLPVTDDLLATKVDTVEHGTLAFQEYFVRYRWEPVVKRVWFEGAETARLSDAAAAALHEADIIVISRRIRYYRLPPAGGGGDAPGARSASWRVRRCQPIRRGQGRQGASSKTDEGTGTGYLAARPDAVLCRVVGWVGD